jgi:hypothetical protein
MQKPHKSVDRFADDREALDFIASRIADEAQRDGVPLSEVERKMLYFSETAWTLSDIWKASDEFDREYEQTAYERKISKLIQKAVARAKKLKDEEFDGWNAAVHLLSEHDRCILVMIRQAGVGLTFRSARPINYRWRFWAICIVAGALFSGFTWALERFDPSPGVYYWSGYRSRFADTLSLSLWAFPIALIIVYELLRLLLGAAKIDEIDDRVTEWIFTRRKRGK